MPTITGLRSSSAISGTSTASRPRSTISRSRSATSAARAPRAPPQQWCDSQASHSALGVGQGDRRKQEHAVVPQVCRHAASGHHDQRPHGRVADDPEGHLHPGLHGLHQDFWPCAPELGLERRHRQSYGGRRREARSHQSSFTLVGSAGIGKLDRHGETDPGCLLDRALGAGHHTSQQPESVGSSRCRASDAASQRPSVGRVLKHRSAPLPRGQGLGGVRTGSGAAGTARHFT